MNKKITSWSSAAPWYDEYLETNPDSLQAQVIAPNLLRMLALKKEEQVLDLACGQGYFSRLMAETGAVVTGLDISDALIMRARERTEQKEITYITAPADATGLPAESMDRVVMVLALENIESIERLFAEIARVLKKDGKVMLVMLHPAFRIPQHSDWGYDEKKEVQYRRVDKYLSEVAVEIAQHPFKEEGKKEITTITFHRSLQWHMKIFKKQGFVIATIEEWISHKKSQLGSKKEIEDKARKEFPMFLAVELKKSN